MRGVVVWPVCCLHQAHDAGIDLEQIQIVRFGSRRSLLRRVYRRRANLSSLRHCYSRRVARNVTVGGSLISLSSSMWEFVIGIGALVSSHGVIVSDFRSIWCRVQCARSLYRHPLMEPPHRSEETCSAPCADDIRFSLCIVAMFVDVISPQADFGEMVTILHLPPPK